MAASTSQALCSGLSSVRAASSSPGDTTSSLRDAHTRYKIANQRSLFLGKHSTPAGRLLLPARPSLRRARSPSALRVNAVIESPPNGSVRQGDKSSPWTPEEEEGGRALYSKSGVTLNGAEAKVVGATVVATSNGSAVKMVLAEEVVKNGAANGAANGALNGAAKTAGAAAFVVEEKIGEGSRGVEELTVEDRPWFEKARASNVQVSVTPGGRWNHFKTYSVIQRTFEIWSFVIAFLVKAWLINRPWMYRGGITEAKKVEKRQDLARWLKEGLLRLGPTFIKIGQQFSTRSDLLAQEYIAELSELQDQVPPFESDTALAIVESELGKPIYEVFERFDRDPIAAASLGQVHRARLQGREVVVKVQRPGLKDLFDIDLKNLRVLAVNLQKIDPKSDGAKRDWVAIYDECASVLYEEIDYTKEGKNADRFRENFKDMDYVKVPTVYWQYTTSQMLVMEYTPGIKINRIDALDKLQVDRKRLARYCVESYLEQILSHGFFHADPHPGNIAVDDVNGGRLIFYDFGMMGSIPSDIREGLVEAFYGVYEKDPDKVLDAMVQMGVLVPTGDRTAVRRTAQFFLNSFEERLSQQQAEAKAKEPMTKEEALAKRKMRLSAIGEDLLAIAADQPFRFPATFTFVVRAFSVLDGIGKGLDPKFDISEIAKPYALELLRFREVGSELFFKELRKRWDRQAQAFKNLLRQPSRVEKLADVILRLEQGDLKLRVRTLENERAFKRVATMQNTIGSAIAAATLMNVASAMHIAARKTPATALLLASAVFGIRVLIGLMQVKKLDEQEKLIMGVA
ncbi:hypothetical protein CLOM_g3584 [Closterium sp. NIES-68]|nr:hypothetical protein CLOM_g3584 [Closterium sp. NIES-68]GJP63723.1 hypothetical protein CLOP_g20777 [Closterium sp. NIES-67]